MKKFYLLLFIITFKNLCYLETMTIQKGMKGYGLSVFRGWQSEKFEVEIIDIIKNSNPKRNIILAKLNSEILSNTGIIAGMSGSPVYINGKIIGAIAYTWQFSKEPICGITPLESMIDEFEEQKLQTINNMKPIATHTVMKGLNSNIKDYLINRLGLSEIVSEYNFEPIPSINNTLSPGDAIAINFITGDISLSSIGTVTYVSNNDIYIFGHPLNNNGRISLPISKAYIYYSIPNNALSFKIGTGSDIIGSTVYDGANGVYCKVGISSSMIPINTLIINNSKTNNYSYQIIDNKYYFTSLFSSSIVSCVLNSCGILENKILKTSLVYKFKDNDYIYTYTNNSYYSFLPNYYNILSFLSELENKVNLIYNNSFEKFNLINLKIEVEILDEKSFYIIDNVLPDKNNYITDDTIFINILLRNFQSSYINKYLQINIPKNLPTGSYRLIIGGKDYVRSELYKQYPDYYSIRNKKDLINYLNNVNDNRILSVILVKSESGTYINATKSYNLPEIQQRIINSYKNTEKTINYPYLLETEFELEYPVFGVFNLNININQKDRIISIK